MQFHCMTMKLLKRLIIYLIKKQLMNRRLFTDFKRNIKLTSQLITFRIREITKERLVHTIFTKVFSQSIIELVTALIDTFQT